MICAFESDIPFCYMKMQKKLSYGRSGRCLSGRFFFTSGKLLQKVFISTATMETVEMKKTTPLSQSPLGRMCLCGFISLAIPCR